MLKFITYYCLEMNDDYVTLKVLQVSNIGLHGYFNLGPLGRTECLDYVRCIEVQNFADFQD